MTSHKAPKQTHKYFVILIYLLTNKNDKNNKNKKLTLICLVYILKSGSGTVLVFLLVRVPFLQAQNYRVIY